MQYMNRRLRNTILIVVMLFGTLFSLLSMLSINSYGNALRESIIGEITNETANSTGKRGRYGKCDECSRDQYF